MLRGIHIVAVLGIMLLSLSLAACQNQSPKTGSTVASSTATPKSPATSMALTSGTNGKHESTGVFDDRMKVAVTTLMSHAFEACINDLTGGTAGFGGGEACLSQKMAMALDPDGDAAKYCAGEVDADAAFNCALSGTIVKKLRSKSGVAMTAETWSDAEKSLRQELLALGVDRAFTCLKEGNSKTPEFRKCLSDAILTRMDAQTEDAIPCLKFDKDEVFGQCVGEAGLVSQLEVAASRNQ